MTDLASTPADSGGSVSTTLEPNAPAQTSGGGAVTPPAEDAPKEPSLRDTIADEMKKDAAPKEDAKADDAKPADGSDKGEDGKGKGEKADKGKDDAKPAKEAKADADAEDVKAAKVDDKTETKTDDAKGDKSDDKPGHYQPPKSFLADSREKWTNVPRAVQRDIDNVVRQHEAEVTELKQATERYESLREFDDLARSNGRDLRESLSKMSQIEDLMQANPYAGLNAILQEIGPKKPDGTPVSLFEVAQFISQQGPQKWQQIVGARPQAQNDQQRVDPQVEALQREIAQMKTQQTAQSVIEPFKRDHPRYDELKSDIAMFLKSGRIPASLSPSDRLAAAYDMAERINPPSNVEEPAPKTSPDADGRAEPSSAARKSISSAPGSVSTDYAPERGGSRADILREEMRRHRRA